MMHFLRHALCRTASHRPRLRRAAWLISVWPVLLMLIANPAMAASQRLDAIGDAAVAYVQANHPWQGLYVRLQPPMLDERLSLMACAEPLRALLPVGGRIAQRTSIAVSCPGNAGWTVHVSVIAEAQADVLVARHAIARHDSIRPDDVIRARRDITRLPYGYVQSLPTERALQAKMGIAQGAVITPSMTQAADVIRRGDLVAIELSDTRMAISMRGVALANAAAGERVTVKNSQSGRTIQGEAIASGRVRVQ